MLCPKCGKKNDDSACTCEKCGTELKDETKKKRYISLKKKTIIGLLILIIIILFVVNLQLKKYTSSENVALSYFENATKGNWDKVYGYFDLPESHFVSKTMFKEVMKDTDRIECSDYQIKENNSVETAMNDVFNNEDEGQTTENISKIVTIEYVNKESSEKKAKYNVQLVKLKKKKWLFYDNWKVVPKDMVIKNYTIRTVAGVDVEFDGKELDGSYKKNKGEEKSKEIKNDIYIIPAIFKGKHSIAVSGKFIEPFNDEVECDQYKSKQYIYTDVEVRDNLKKEIKDNNFQIVKDIYKNAIDNVKVNDLSLKYGFYKNNKSELKNDYNNLVDNLDKVSFAKKIKVKKLSLKEYKVVKEQTKIDSNSIYITIKYECKYDGKFTKDKGEDEKETIEEDGTLEGNITYQYKDGKWYISKMYLDRIYMY